MWKSPSNKFGKRLSLIRADQMCRGCGRNLPKGSWMLIWSIWKNEGLMKFRIRLCSECQEVIYGCNDRESVCYQQDAMLVRDMCERCNEYPFCDKSKYLRKSNVNDWCFSSLKNKAAAPTKERKVLC